MKSNHYTIGFSDYTVCTALRTSAYYYIYVFIMAHAVYGIGSLVIYCKHVLGIRMHVFYTIQCIRYYVVYRLYQQCIL